MGRLKCIVRETAFHVIFNGRAARKRTPPPAGAGTVGMEASAELAEDGRGLLATASTAVPSPAWIGHGDRAAADAESQTAADWRQREC